MNLDPKVSEAIKSLCEGLSTDPSQKLKDLIERGWQETYSAAFGDFFVSGLAPHHAEALEWHWNARLTLLQGKYPEHDAYFPIWSRGHFKSGIARRIAVMDGLLSFAYDQPAYILYLSRNKEQVLKHAKSIETLLQSARIRDLCPEMSRERLNEQKRSKGWTAKFLYTAANVIFHFAGLDEGLAGGNLETSGNTDGEDKPSDVRVTLFVPDDIDGREDSPTIAENRFNTLTNEVLPMGQDNTLSFFAQNLISKYSTMYRIYKQRARVMTGRKPTEPVPAVLNLVTEERTVEGIVQDVYVSGEPTWNVWDARRIQAEINRYGLPAFLTECQHEVDKNKAGLILHTFNDDVHVISESEFEAVCGRAAWKEWYKVPFNDWARTKTEKHSNVAGWMCVASQNSPAAGFTFIIPFSFPENTMPEDVAERFLTSLTPYAYGGVTWRQLVRDAHLRANAGEHFDSLSQRVEYERAHLKAVAPKYAKPVLRQYNVHGGAMSHSEDTVRAIYNEVFGFGFIPSNPGITDAVEDIVRAFKIDFSQPHPFRNMNGYTRTFIIAPDDTTVDMVLVNGVYVYPPRPYPEALQPHDLHDSDLMRYQLRNYRYAAPVVTATGERVDVPLKINDDFFQGIQLVYHKRLLSNIKLSPDELAEMNVHPNFRLDNLKDKEGEDYSRAAITRQVQLNLPKALKGRKAAPSRLARFQR